MINDSPLELSISGYKRIFLTADWHLWLKDRENGTNEVYKRPDFDEILEPYYQLNSDDFLIHLGDLTDDEMTDYEKLIEVFKGMKCARILVRGNNDKFDKAAYKKCGFINVCDNGLVMNNILFTHEPVSHTYDMNVHAHQHGHRYYWSCPFDKHLDIWNIERTPVPYENLQKMYDEYVSSGINDISDKHMTGPEFKKWRGHYNGKKKEEW